MSPSSSSATEIVRRTFLKIEPATVLATVDSLDLRGHGKVSAVIGVPLRNLKQRRDVVAFASSAPIAALRALLELLALEPLEKVIEILGEHADSPNFDQLSAAVDRMLAEGSSANDVVALLTFAVAEEFAAAGHCRRLLEERPDLQLPELPELGATPSLLVPKEIAPEVREQRQARREQEKQRKKGPSSVRPARPVKAKPAEKAAHPSAQSSSAGRSAAPEPPSAVRRRPTLTPGELERFDDQHLLCGFVVLAEVPFDAVDPTQPELKSKERPALVVGAAADGVLVRAIYSNPGPTRRVFLAWRRLGLDHISYLDDVRTAVTVASTASIVRLGQLSDREWNALL